MKRRGAAGILLGLLVAAGALADGGRVRARQESGPFSITVFTAPEPLTAGPADISVLVQERQGGSVILDARVALEWSGPEPARSAEATAGTNRLLKSAVAELNPPGVWHVEVTVRKGEATGRASCDLPVDAAGSRLSAVWPLLALPPLGIALFALGRTVRVSRARPATSR